MPDAALDPARLTRLRKLGGDDLVHALIDSFLAEAPARRALLEGEDATAIAHVAHTLVAGAGQLGAGPLSDGARALEEAVRGSDPATMRQLKLRLITTFDDALVALRRFRETA
jgi:hypothetical protein